jgi:hypothetical protein
MRRSVHVISVYIHFCEKAALWLAGLLQAHTVPLYIYYIHSSFTLGQINILYLHIDT